MVFQPKNNIFQDIAKEEVLSKVDNLDDQTVDQLLNEIQRCQPWGFEIGQNLFSLATYFRLQNR